MKRHSCGAVLALLLVPTVLALQSDAQDDKFIGWMGESYRPTRLNATLPQQSNVAQGVIGSEMEGGDGNGVDAVEQRRMLPLSWSPRAFHYQGFLDAGECDALVAEAAALMGSKPGGHDRSVRLQPSAHRTVEAIDDRIARWTLLPHTNGEALQVSKALPGDPARTPTTDWDPSQEGEDGSIVLASVIVFLSDVPAGGELALTSLSAREPGQSTSSCGLTGSVLRPRKGDAVLIWSLASDGRPEPRSVHGFCPVLKGEGWVAVKRLHVKRLTSSQANDTTLGLEHPRQDLPGWLAPTYRDGAPTGLGADASGMAIISWQPRIMLWRRFLTDDECDYMRREATPELRRSGVSNAITGESEVDNVRTSSGMFFKRFQNPAIRRIEKRLAAWTMLATENGEGIQVLHYEKTQKYDPHHDYFSHKDRDANGGNRMATVLMYLTDVLEGGETVFPKVPVPPDQTADAFSACAMKGLAVKPRKGDAILFWSIRPDGTFDPASLHGSCPVIRGEKWSATKWIHVGHFGEGHNERTQPPLVRVIYAPSPPPILPGCVDKHASCNAWAEEGECDNNAGYMLGTKQNPGNCLASCGRCDLMRRADAAPT